MGGDASDASAFRSSNEMPGDGEREGKVLSMMSESDCLSQVIDDKG